MDKPEQLAGPAALSEEHCTLYGRSTRPGNEGPGFEAQQALDAYSFEPPGEYGCGWRQAVAGRSQ